jgi:hypothetical protein
VVADVTGECPTLAGLDPDERAEIWRGALAASSGGRRRKGRHDICCFAPGGVIEVIFAVPREVDAERRVAFRRRVEEASAAATVHSAGGS